METCLGERERERGDGNGVDGASAAGWVDSKLEGRRSETKDLGWVLDVGTPPPSPSMMLQLDGDSHHCPSIPQ